MEELWWEEGNISSAGKYSKTKVSTLKNPVGDVKVRHQLANIEFDLGLIQILLDF